MAWNEQRIAEVRKFLEGGGGLVLIHSATWTMPEPSREIADLTGVGGFVKYRHGPITLTISQADHPICRGLPPASSLRTRATGRRLRRQTPLACRSWP